MKAWERDANEECLDEILTAVAVLRNEVDAQHVMVAGNVCTESEWMEATAAQSVKTLLVGSTKTRPKREKGSELSREYRFLDSPTGFLRSS